MKTISVVGSLNMDLTVTASRVPNAGETIRGENFRLIPGGKGANQAVAASRFRAKTFMIGCVGDDVFGQKLIESLSANNVHTDAIQILSDVSTGTATIIVEENGDNRIIITPGANGCFSPSVVENLWSQISKSSIIILQHEIPLNTVKTIIDKAHEEEIYIVLNPAPVYFIEPKIYNKLDVLVVNETEAAFLCDFQLSNRSIAFDAAEKLRNLGARTVIITLGQNGAVLVNKKNRFYQPAYSVNAIDTTAAGDTFVGVYAASKLIGFSDNDGLLFATAAAGLSVTRLGAQPSIPDYEEVVQFINNSE